MGYPLRLYEPNCVYEITCRTIQGRYLLRPSPEANDLILGIIGRAQVLYPEVAVFEFVFLSTHSTWLLSGRADPSELARFVGYVNGSISLELGKLHDWPGALWERPARPIPITDDLALRRRHKYLVEQGCKEGLVESPYHWPGASSIPAHCRNRRLRGRRFNRDEQTRATRRARRAGEKPPPATTFAEHYDVTLSKLPHWADKSDDAYAAAMRRLVREV